MQKATKNTKKTSVKKNKKTASNAPTASASARKSTRGRKSIITPEVLSKLEHAYSLNATDAEACFYAGLSTSSLYRFQEKNSEFRERKQALKASQIFRAKEIINNQLINGDVSTAKWLLERLDKEHYSLRQEVTGNKNNPLNIDIGLDFGDD